MDIFGFIEAYKFFQRFQKSDKFFLRFRKSEYMMDYILDGEMVLSVNSLAWDNEMVGKYEYKIRALIKQMYKEMDEITNGCGSIKFIAAAIKWGVSHSSHRKEAILTTKWIFLPMFHFDKLLSGQFNYEGRFCSDYELNHCNKLLDEFITKYESETNISRRPSLISWVSRIISSFISWVFALITIIVTVILILS